MKPRKVRNIVIALMVVALMVAMKAVWVYAYTKDNGTFEGEKKDILARKNYLVEKFEGFK